MSEKMTARSFIRMAAVLTLICTLVAALLSFVFSATNGVYEENVRRVKAEAIASLFACEAVNTQELSTDAAVEKLYLVSEGERALGYCADVCVNGFGGEIQMLVAMSAGGEMLGVRIVSMSETPGLGSRVGEESHLSQYVGSHKGELTLGEEIDAVSGATISSRAVNEGVNVALGAMRAHQSAQEGIS